MAAIIPRASAVLFIVTLALSYASPIHPGATHSWRPENVAPIIAPLPTQEDTSKHVGQPTTLYLPTLSKSYTPPPINDWQPSFSPDGQQIAFVRQYVGEQADVFLMDADGSNMHNLTQTPDAEEDTPVFSPDGLTIAFASDRTGQWDIYTTTVSGTGQVANPVIVHNESDEIHPSFSPDGSLLAFASNRGGNWDIYTAPIAGGAWTRLTTALDAELFPTFSTDGETIFYHGDSGGNSDIYVLDITGRASRRLTNDPAFDGYPSITPDSSGVVFVSTRSGDAQVYSINISGAGLRRLTSEPGYHAHTPRLSSDGHTLLYAAAPAGGTYEIRTTSYQSPLQILASYGASDTLGLCDWTSGVFALGWSEAWQHTGDDAYAQMVKTWVDSCSIDTYTIDHVNDGLLGHAALVAYQFDPRPGYLAFAQRVADYLTYIAPRTTGGVLKHLPDSVWADTLIGTVPFLVKMAEVTGDSRYLDEAATQVIGHAVILQDPATGLFRHAWQESTGQFLSTSYWSRGNGWNMIASVQLLNAMPVTHTERAQIVAILQSQSQGLAAWQNDSGLWHTIVNRADFYLESSGTGGIAYGLNRGIQKGWLPPTLATNTQKAWLGLWQKVSPDGMLADVSAPTWPMPEEDYNTMPHDEMQPYGQGMALLFLTTCRY